MATDKLGMHPWCVSTALLLVKNGQGGDPPQRIGGQGFSRIPEHLLGIAGPTSWSRIKLH